jgi:hypothetical protein
LDLIAVTRGPSFEFSYDRTGNTDVSCGRIELWYGQL